MLLTGKILLFSRVGLAHRPPTIVVRRCLGEIIWENGVIPGEKFSGKRKSETQDLLERANAPTLNLFKEGQPFLICWAWLMEGAGQGDFYI